MKRVFYNNNSSEYFGNKITFFRALKRNKGSISKYLDLLLKAIGHFLTFLNK
jgi:hypothetical protein